MQTRIVTLAVAAPRSEIFKLLADVEKLPAWAGGFCEWIELHRGGWRAFTSLGELAVEARVNDAAGRIELQFDHVSGPTISVPIQVRSDGENGSLVNAICTQPAGLSDEHYARLFKSLIAGLRELAERFRPRLVLS